MIYIADETINNSMLKIFGGTAAPPHKRDQIGITNQEVHVGKRQKETATSNKAMNLTPKRCRKCPLWAYISPQKNYQKTKNAANIGFKIVQCYHWLSGIER